MWMQDLVTEYHEGINLPVTGRGTLMVEINHGLDWRRTLAPEIVSTERVRRKSILVSSTEYWRTHALETLAPALTAGNYSYDFPQ
jgi:hypothetical protein